MGKKIQLEGEAYFIRPFHLDKGENLEDGHDLKDKLDKIGGQYSAEIALPQFNNKDDAAEWLSSLGIPVSGMQGNRIKRRKDGDTGEVKILYKIDRPHMEPKFENPHMGPPKVYGPEGDEPWDEEVLIGNGSKVKVELDVWQGKKATKIRWERMRVLELVPYEPEEGGF